LGIIVFESLLPVVLVIATGLFLRETKIVSSAQWEGIELLSYWLLFPVLVLDSLINMDISKINLGIITKSYLSAVTAQLIIIWIIRKPLKRHLKITDRTFSTIFQTSTRWNAFVALAIANNLAGDQGLAIVALLMAITVPILNFVNIIVLTFCCTDTPPTFKSAAIRTLKVPLIWGAVLGLSLNLLQFSLYEPIAVSLDIIGRAGLGMGLLTVGAGLHVKTITQARLPMFVGVTAKLFIFPLLVFVSCLIFQVSGLMLQIAMVSASVATAMNGYVLARQMGGDARLYAATVSLQTAISVVSIPLVLLLIADYV